MLSYFINSTLRYDRTTCKPCVEPVVTPQYRPNVLSLGTATYNHCTHHNHVLFHKAHLNGKYLHCRVGIVNISFCHLTVHSLQYVEISQFNTEPHCCTCLHSDYTRVKMDVRASLNQTSVNTSDSYAAEDLMDQRMYPAAYSLSLSSLAFQLTVSLCT